MALGVFGFCNKYNRNNRKRHKYPNGDGFEDVHVDRMARGKEDDLSEKKFSNIKVSINLGHEVLNERDVLSIDDKGDLLSIAKLLVKHKHLNLRQAERIFALARIALCEMATNSKLFADVYFLMTYLKVCEPDVFENINGINYRLQELVNAFETLANDELIKDDKRRHNDFIIAVCHLLNCYAESIRNKYRQGDDRFETIYDEQSNDHHPNIAFNKFDNETCFTLLKHYNERQIDLVCEIEHFTKKLALTEPFRIGEII